MKKYIKSIIEQLKYNYPGQRISTRDGFIGIDNGTNALRHSTYIGHAYYEIDGDIYTDYNSKSGEKLLTI